MSLEFEFLVDRADAVPIVSRWYFDEWGHLSTTNSIERTRSQMQDYMHRDKIPFILLATEADEIVGAAQLKYHEMGTMFPDKEHWLGGLYVAPDQRGRGYGSRIVREIVSLAPRYGVRTLHLQTEALDGGLYTRLGWRPSAQTNNHGLDVLVMELQLSG
jgi:GNAT superfamily N-acetyltransferase